MNCLNNEDGFSLVEALIAIVILAVGLLAVAGMQTTAITSNAFSRDGTIAVQMAEEMVDRIRVNGGNNPDIYNGIDTSGSCNAFSEPAKGDCLQWKARLAATRLPDIAGTVQVTADSPIANSANITINLTWGGGRKVVFSTFLETWGT